MHKLNENTDGGLGGKKNEDKMLHDRKHPNFWLFVEKLISNVQVEFH